MRFQILQAGCGMCTLPLAMLLFLLRDTESSPRKHEHITCAPPSEDEQTGVAAMGNIIHPDLLTKGILKNLPPGVGWENDRQAVAAAAAEAALCFLRESLHVHLTGMDSSGTEEDMFSSRVMFRSEAPRSPPRLQQSNDCTGNVNRGRAKRYARRRMHGAQRQLPVCDSDSGWTNKSVAIDIKGNVVEVLKNIRTNTGLLSQYFYETWCRSSLAPQWGCRGVDKRYWRSQCKTTQSFVRALTKENGRHVQWRFIRINTACVCALQSIKLRS